MNGLSASEILAELRCIRDHVATIGTQVALIKGQLPSLATREDLGDLHRELNDRIETKVSEHVERCPLIKRQKFASRGWFLDVVRRIVLPVVLSAIAGVSFAFSCGHGEKTIDIHTDKPEIQVVEK